MAYTFKKLGEVEALTEVPEGANALIEINGAVKRVPGSGLGGGAIKTAVIKLDPSSNNCHCENMTFDEAVTLIGNNEPLNAILVILGQGTLTVNHVSLDNSSIIITPTQGKQITWTSSGMTTEQSSPK